MCLALCSVSIVSVFCILLLFISELRLYLAVEVCSSAAQPPATPALCRSVRQFHRPSLTALLCCGVVQTVDRLSVDVSRGEKLQINFDVTFPHIPCSRMCAAAAALLFRCVGDRFLFGAEDSHVCRGRCVQC